MGARKIKILRIINRFNIGGPTYNATFLTAFMGDKYETLLVGGLPEKGESDSLYIPEQYNVKPVLIEELVRTPSLSSDRAAYKKLKEIIIEFKPDIVHTHASKAGALGRKAASSCGVPIIVHTFHGHVFHSYFGKLKTEVFKRIERNLAKKSDAIVAISENQKLELSQIHNICPANKISVVSLGFDLDQFKLKKETCRKSTRAKYNVSDSEVAIAIVGRLAPIKNHKYFFEVIEKVFNMAKVPVKCFIVGDGPEREEVENMINRLPKKHNKSVILTSWIKDIGEFNAGMDVICLTSKNEGTPVSLIEAQASGIPVVSTNVGGVMDVVEEGVTGYIIDINDQDLFVSRLIKLIENENIRKKMSQNGWNFVREKFHYNTLVKKMDHLYTDLLLKKKNEIDI